MKDSGQRREFETGAVRDRGDFKPRPDLISPHANTREGAWLGKGAIKYTPRNWEKGMPISECVASLCRHLEAYKLGLKDEDHMAAIRTNAGFILHFEEEIAAGHLPTSLSDMPHYGPRPGDTRIVDGKTQMYVKIERPIDHRDPVEIVRPASWVSPETEKKIADRLASVFSNNGAIYAAEDLKEGCTFIISKGKAYASFASVPEGSIYENGIATEDVPAGSPIELTGVTDGLWSPSTEVPQTSNDEFIDLCNGLDIAFNPTEKKPVEQICPIVYLCGPITGETVDSLWRDAATAFFNSYGISTLDPLRGKKLDKIGNLGLSYGGELASPKMGDRDKGDVFASDAIFAHFPYMPPRQSIGSLMEMGAAAIGLSKPVILCTKEVVFNDHLFCRRFCTIVGDFEKALLQTVQLVWDAWHKAHNKENVK
jgi:hypothetical protein